VKEVERECPVEVISNPGDFRSKLEKDIGGA